MPHGDYSSGKSRFDSRLVVGALLLAAVASAAATPPSPAEPEVTAIVPPRVGQGFDIDLKVAGRNFVKATKVSFSNPGVRVTAVTQHSGTALVVSIRVANDASVGASRMFVINPDDTEAEASFEVTKKGVVTATGPAKPGSPGSEDATYTQRFDAFHLGNPTEIFHVKGRVKGSLIISSGTVRYQEGGQTLVNISSSQIRQAKTAPLGGFNIKLKSGKTLHFAAASLRPSDARTIVDALHKAMPAGTATEDD